MSYPFISPCVINCVPGCASLILHHPQILGRSYGPYARSRSTDIFTSWFQFHRACPARFRLPDRQNCGRPQHAGRLWCPAAWLHQSHITYGSNPCRRLDSRMYCSTLLKSTQGSSDASTCASAWCAICKSGANPWRVRERALKTQSTRSPTEPSPLRFSPTSVSSENARCLTVRVLSAEGRRGTRRSISTPASQDAEASRQSLESLRSENEALRNSINEAEVSRRHWYESADWQHIGSPYA